MDRVGKQRDTPRKDHYHELKNSGGGQAEERPFDGPNAAICGEQSRIDRPVAVIMMGMTLIIMGVRMVYIAHKEIILLGDAIRYSHDLDKQGHRILLAVKVPALLRSTQS